MKKKYKFLLTLILLGILILLSIFLIGKVFHNKEDEQPKVVDSMKSYNYTLEDRDSELMKETYNELKTILNEKEIDMESYAKTLTKLFIIDLFTIDNKRSKYDVGGAEYIYPDSVSNYKLNVEDTLYKTVKTNANGKRNQDLPVVKSVTIDKLEKSKFTIEEKDTFNAYVINASWEYEKDYGYDKLATITCIEKDEKIFIVEYSVGE